MKEEMEKRAVAGESGDAEKRERVLEMIMKAAMTTGMWKELLRRMVEERPDTVPWLYEALGSLAARQAVPAGGEGAEAPGAEGVPMPAEDPLREELLARIDGINEDDLLSSQSNALWAFRLMMQMGSLERALTAAEMDRSVFLRNITEALGYDEGDRFRVYNFLRRYDK